MVVKFGGGVDDLIWKTKGHGLGYLSRQQALLFFFSVFSSRLSRPSRRQIVVKGERYLGIGRCDATEIMSQWRERGINSIRHNCNHKSIITITITINIDLQQIGSSIIYKLKPLAQIHWVYIF